MFFHVDEFGGFLAAIEGCLLHRLRLADKCHDHPVVAGIRFHIEQFDSRNLADLVGDRLNDFRPPSFTEIRYALN